MTSFTQLNSNVTGQAAENNVSYPHHGVGSYCPHSSHNFAVETAREMVRAVEGYEGGVMELRAYTPPYDEGCFPAGFLVITLTREGRRPVRFGIEFGQRDEGGGYVREGLDVDAWTEGSHATLTRAASMPSTSMRRGGLYA